MTINLVCVGNLKEKYWIEACDEYRKRLSKFCKLKLVEVDEQNKYINIGASSVRNTHKNCRMMPNF